MNFARQVLQIVFTLSTVLAAAVTAASATADPLRTLASADSPSSGFPGRDSFQSVSSSRSLSQKDIIFHSLLSTEGKDLAWPSFPRTWHEQSVSDYVSSNSAVGVNTGLVSGGVSIDYKWTLKSSVVLIASNRSENATLDSNGVTVSPVDQPLEFEIFRWDPVTRRTLPNIRKGYPMVAFCAFEATLNYGVGTKGGIQFLGSGQILERGRTRSITHTLFSRFFQVDGEQSPHEMLERVCAGQFRKQVENYVNRDFSRAVIEMYATISPDNECQPDPKNDGPQGDAGCMDWHSKNFDKAMQKITIPRCVFAHNGVHRCQITSRENGNCSMYWDKTKRQAVSPEAAAAGGGGARRYSRATDAPYEFPCDPAGGLTCTMVKQPWIALSVPVWQGTARCLRK